MDELNQYIFEHESITTAESSMIFSLVILIIAITFSVILTYKVRKTMTSRPEFRDVIKLVFYIQLALTVRFVISFIDYYIWFASSGEYSLNGVYESIIWLAPIILTINMIYSKNIIIIPRVRETRRKGLILANMIFFISSIILFFAINLLDFALFWEILIYGVMVVELLFLIYLIYLEFNFLNSGINKIRLNTLMLVYITFAVYLLTIMVLYGLIPILYPSGVLPTWYHNMIIILITASPILISLGFYWLVHTPEFMRKKISE